MAALDFPASPTDGQVYNNWVYSTSKGAWKAKPLTPGQAQPSATPPANPSNGDQWYNTIDGVLYIYYNDGNSSQWVESRSAITSDGYYSPNYIINGAFDFWQRGTSSTAAGYQTADRWYGNASASTTFSRETSNVPANFQYAYKITTGATATPYVQQPIETLNSIQLAGKTVTMSAYLAASTNLSVSLQLYYSTSVDNAAGGSWTLVGSQANNVTSSWARFKATFVVPSTAKTVMFVVMGPSVASGTSIYVTGAQLEEGAVAMPFRRNVQSIAGEFAACQRYFQSSYDFVAPGTIGYTGHVRSDAVYEHTTTSYISHLIKLAVPMRATPTCVIYSPATGASGKVVRDRMGVSSADGDVYVDSASSPRTIAVYSSGTSLATGIGFHYTASAEL